MKEVSRAGAAGLAAMLLLLAGYLSLLTLVSDWQFTLEEFARYAPFIVALAAGFGTQVALYVYMRRLIRRAGPHGKVVAASGTASAAAMVSCCAHYLANLLPILGVSGLALFISQYQVELYWIGLAFNAAGIAYLGNRCLAAYQEHAQCLAPA